EEACVAGDSPMGIPGIAVVHFALERIFPPAVPGGRITPVLVAEGRVVDHLPFVSVAHLGRREFDVAPSRRKAGGAEAERAVELLLQKARQRLSGDLLDQIA